MVGTQIEVNNANNKGVQKMRKDVTICFRTSEDLRASLEKVAGGERRSLSSIIETVLYNYLKEKKELRSLKNEKRIYGRREVSLPAFVYKRGSKESTLQTGIIFDLSLGGLRFLSPRNMMYCKKVNSTRFLPYLLKKRPLK